MNQGLDLENNNYFKSLEPYIQETITQSGIIIESEEQLRQCVRNLKKDKLDN